MGYLGLIIFVLLVGSIAIVIDRRMDARQAASEEEEAPEEKGGFLSRFRKGDSVKLFEKWAKESLTKNADLKAWLASLTAEETKNLVRNLEVHCRKHGLKLAWLGEELLNAESELKNALESAVISYCQTAHESTKVAKQVELFSTLLDFNKNPDSRKYADLRENLFTSFVEKGLADITLSEYIKTPDKEKNKKVTETLENVAKKDRKAFNAALAEALELNGHTAEEDKPKADKKSSSRKTAAAAS
jgi:hypothetical protein